MAHVGGAKAVMPDGGDKHEVPRSKDGGMSQAMPRKLKPRRYATVYDAVAGRLKSTHLFAKDNPRQANWYRDATLAPEEALFQGAHAPPRHEENDFYFSNDALLIRSGVPVPVLPDSDLLAAIHDYAGRFYEALETRGREKDTDDNESHEPHSLHDKRGKQLPFDSGTSNKSTSPAGPEPRLLNERSMNETGLLAFGILLEEASRHLLGARGDLVFTEAAEDEDKPKDAGEKKKPRKRRSWNGAVNDRDGVKATDAPDDQEKRSGRPRKKRKISPSMPVRNKAW